MIPILFDSTETSFTTNGIGRLTDAISCYVTEERNGPYELEMQYPITGAYFSEITHSRIIFATPADGKQGQPFRIYRIEKPLDGICTIYAEHISYELNQIPVMPFEAATCRDALNGLVSHAGQTCPFTVWTDKGVVGTYKTTEPRPFRELLGGTSGSILDVYGTGEYEFDKWQVKLYTHRGSDTGVVIRYAKNLTELVNDENIESVYTGVCPYWKGEDGTLVTLPEIAIWSETYANYPYKRTKIIDFSSEWQEAPTVAELRTRTEQYIAANDIGIPKLNIDVSFVPLWQTEGASIGSPKRTLVFPSASFLDINGDMSASHMTATDDGEGNLTLSGVVGSASLGSVHLRKAGVSGNTLDGVYGTVLGDTLLLDADARFEITYHDYKILERVNLCDTVSVVYSALGVSAKAKVIRTVFDVLRDRYETIELGEARTSLAQQIVDIDTSIEEVNANADDIYDRIKLYTDHQTELIRGGLGGYVYLKPNANGQPEEILIMDDPDIATATDIIRMNKNGIGFSRNGYNGPFSTAWTIDGVFNASFIGAGELDAAEVNVVNLNADNINSGELNSNYIKLHGKMDVYNDALSAKGGYIGYMAGATASGTSTNGIAIMAYNAGDTQGQGIANHVIATNAGVRMTNITSNDIYASLNISGGILEYSSTDDGAAVIQGDVYLNAKRVGGGIGYAGTTHIQNLEVYGGAEVSGSVKCVLGYELHNTTPSGALVGKLWQGTYGGQIQLYTLSGTNIGSIYAASYGGALDLGNASGNTRVNLYVDATSGGCLTLTGPDGLGQTLTRDLITKLVNL